MSNKIKMYNVEFNGEDFDGMVKYKNNSYKFCASKIGVFVFAENNKPNLEVLDYLANMINQYYLPLLKQIHNKITILGTFDFEDDNPEFNEIMYDWKLKKYNLHCVCCLPGIFVNFSSLTEITQNEILNLYSKNILIGGFIENFDTFEDMVKQYQIDYKLALQLLDISESKYNNVIL